MSASVNNPYRSTSAGNGSYGVTANPATRVEENDPVQAITDRIRKKREEAKAKMKGIKGAKGLPLISSGYMDLMLEEPVLQEQAALNRVSLKQTLRDMGVSYQKGANGKYSWAPRKDTPFGAYQEADRQAKFSSASRGAGTVGMMRKAAFEPAKEELIKSASRARSDTELQNRLAQIRLKRQKETLLPSIPGYAADSLYGGK